MCTNLSLALHLPRLCLSQPPTCSVDTYSFGIILQEIYTREDPYAELAETLTPRQVVRAVCSNHLRPQPNDDIPMRVRQIMEIAWADNPASRPSFEQVRVPPFVD